MSQPNYVQSDVVEDGGSFSDRLGGVTHSRFIAEDSKATINNVALVARLAALLVPLFLVLDYAVYPDHFESFLYLRMGCVIMILGVLYCTRMKWARRSYRLFAMSVPLIAALFISLMINRVEDPGTPYYAGLTLCLVAIGALLHWTYQEAIVSTLLILGMYLLACSSQIGEGMDQKSFGYFVNNCLFISAVGFVVIVGSYTHHGTRIREFLWRTHLRRNQNELEEMNAELKEAVSALEETESQLIQSDKMSFLGQMSAGVIHEIGNPLNFSNQALFILRKKAMKSGANDDAIEVIDDLQEGLDRIKDIVSEMREFSHSGAGYGSSFRVAESVDSALRMLGRQIEESGTVVTVDVAPDLEIHGVKNQITQVVINLVHNAVQAMVSEGCGAGSVEIAGSTTSDDGVYLTVKDNGPGILPENAPKLFDPFFTTKDPGEGTGLGLSICYRIIEAHGGTIRADAAAEKGAVFTVTLPAIFPVFEREGQA